MTFLLRVDTSSPSSLLYITGIVGGLFLNSTIPLFFELAMETIYPSISEGTGAGLLSIGVTVVQIVYLAIPQLVSIGVQLSCISTAGPLCENTDSKLSPGVTRFRGAQPVVDGWSDTDICCAVGFHGCALPTYGVGQQCIASEFPDRCSAGHAWLAGSYGLFLR